MRGGRRLEIGYELALLRFRCLLAVPESTFAGDSIWGSPSRVSTEHSSLSSFVSVVLSRFSLRKSKVVPAPLFSGVYRAADFSRTLPDSRREEKSCDGWGHNLSIILA